MIDFSEISHVVAFWFVDGAARHGSDFLACVFRGNDGQWRASYRFRYSASATPFDEDDRRNWYEVRARPADADPAACLAAAMDAAAERLVRQGYCDPSCYHRVEVNGDAKLAWDRIVGQPWINMKLEGDGDLPVNTSQRGSA